MCVFMSIPFDLCLAAGRGGGLQVESREQSDTNKLVIQW